MWFMKLDARLFIITFLGVVAALPARNIDLLRSDMD
jgi:hypothetical protein